MAQVASGPAYPDTFGLAGTSMLNAEDATATATELETERADREAAYAAGRTISSAVQDALTSIHYGLRDRATEQLAAAESALQVQEQLKPHERGRREANLSAVCEAFLTAKSFAYFLETGAAMSRTSLGVSFDDEEYLGGMIGACRQLEQYALRRATALDVHSVRLCRDFIAEVKTELLGFDFRNGPLRRKFDGVKYSQRRCEDMLYELSFSPKVQGPTDDDGPPSKRARMEQDAADVETAPATSVLDKEEWATLRQNYEDHDKQREAVIKDCRDVQKAAKQAIFAAHRRDSTKAEKLISVAKTGALAIHETYIANSPSLRSGSFCNALEELAEAELFFHWLKTVQAGSTPECPRRADIAHNLLKADEYLGALSDWSGEVGRIGVEAATKRDHALVRACLEAAFSAHALLASMQLQGKATKKVEAAERNLRKLETIEYDLAVRANQKGPSMQDTEGDSRGDDGES